MGIQTLRDKEQQHAFQHATSAEVCRRIDNEDLLEFFGYLDYSITGEYVTESRRDYRNETGTSSPNGCG